jgi:hypothetical protein
MPKYYKGSLKSHDNGIIMKKKLLIYFFITGVFTLWFSGSLYSQFLKEDPRSQTIDKKTKSDDKNGDRGYPDHIAFNIKAAREPDRRNSVRITWEVNPGSKHEFIVGRHTEIIDNVDNVLKARPVDTVPSVAKGVLVDENLTPGSYFYVVISKEKSTQREFELYPGVNYTLAAVTIRDDREAGSSGKGIFAAQSAPDSVVVKWDRSSDSGITYSVFRSRDVINTLERLNSAEKVGEAVDVGQIVDRGITGQGLYYYAVTSRARGGSEDVIFRPDVTYTTQGLMIKDEGGYNGLTGLTVRSVEAGIRLDWTADSRGRGVKGFAVYRHSSPIQNYEALRRSEHLVTLDSSVDWYIDRKIKNGAAYYYAVVVKFADGSVDLRLRNGINFSVEPASALAVSTALPVISFEGSYTDGMIELYWEADPVYDGDKECLIFRKSIRPSKYSEIKRGDIVARVPLDRETMKYSTDESGYYYGIIPSLYRKTPDNGFETGINITDAPLNIPKKIEREKIPAREISPSREIDQQQSGRTDIDEILADTFFKGRYHSAINELIIAAANSSDGRVKAKAWLFTGRSYIELKKYDKAVRYLLRDEVVKYYPEESAFWRDFAYRRLK